jgi:hypothetical protein
MTAQSTQQCCTGKESCLHCCLYRKHLTTRRTKTFLQCPCTRPFVIHVLGVTCELKHTQLQSPHSPCPHQSSQTPSHALKRYLGDTRKEEMYHDASPICQWLWDELKHHILGGHAPTQSRNEAKSYFLSQKEPTGDSLLAPSLGIMYRS